MAVMLPALLSPSWGPTWWGWSYRLSRPLYTWRTCIERRRRWLFWRDGTADPLTRREWQALGSYSREVERARWGLRRAERPEEARRALLSLLDAQRRYACDRRWALFPPSRWRAHREEYGQLRRFLKEVERLRWEVRRQEEPTAGGIERALRRAIEAEVDLLRARMRDIRCRKRRYWLDEEYRRLERCARDLEREARHLGR